MDLDRVLRTLHERLAAASVDHALIGALAIAVHAEPRATLDVDLLVAGTGRETLHEIAESMGYRAIHRSEDVANYAADAAEPGIDALFAHRHYALEMLARSRPSTASSIPVPVVDPADLIGLKVQASSNDPRRRRKDVADIERLLRGGAEIDLDRVRTYFRLFDREKELDLLLAEMEER